MVGGPFPPARPSDRTGWARPARARPRDYLLVFSALLAAGTLFAASAFMTNSMDWAPLLPLALMVMGLGGWWLLMGVYGSPLAIQFYFAAIAFMTDAQFRVKGAGDISADWQSALKFLIWIGAGAIGFTHMPPLRTLLARPACACWLAYIAVAMVSSLWSPVAPYSFGCALALLCLFAFSFALTARLSEARILWTLLITLTVFNIGGWFVFFANPELGTSEAWTTGGLVYRMCGLAGQANNLGMVCAKAVGAAFVLWYTRKSGPLAALLLGGFAFVTLVKSDSRTTEIAAVAGIAAVLASRSASLVTAGALMGSLALVALQVFPDLARMLNSGMSRSGDPTEVYTLTGRLEIWDFAWQEILRNPIFGYGYNSSKAVLGSHIGFQNGLMVDSAHNLYLQNLLSVGALGMVPLSILMLYLAWRCVVRPIPIVCYMLVLILVSSMADADAIGMTPTLMTMLFFLISVWPGLEGQTARHPLGPLAPPLRPVAAGPLSARGAMPARFGGVVADEAASSRRSGRR